MGGGEAARGVFFYTFFSFSSVFGLVLKRSSWFSFSIFSIDGLIGQAFVGFVEGDRVRLFLFWGFEGDFCRSGRRTILG